MSRFIETIAALRAPDGCPWDRAQTHGSIAANMLEEAFEAVDAIEEGDVSHLKEELGDVLLQVVLQSQIAADAGEFTIEDVARDATEKMVRRHPHVFGVQRAFEACGLDPDSVSDAADVEEIWQMVKDREREMKADDRARRRTGEGLDPDMRASLLEGVSRSQPALMEALELSRKTVHVGFEWETTDDVWAKFEEERGEYLDAERGSDEAIMEMGDVLFCLVNVARRDHIDPETALRRSCAKFRRRWERMEEMAYHEGLDIAAIGADGLEQLWSRAKGLEERQAAQPRSPRT